MTSQTPARRADLLPSLGVAVSGAVWGLFWIPMRAVEEGGFAGGWGALGFMLLQCVLMIPVMALRWRHLRAAGPALLLTGIFTGAAFALYAVSLVFTEVVRSLLLFYLSPVWSTLLARLLLGERITVARLSALVLGLAGLVVILGWEGGFPLPRNPGDWMALVAGLAWAYGSLRVYDSAGTGALEQAAVFFFAGMLVSLAVLLLPFEGQLPPPALGGIEARTFGILALGALVYLPTMIVIIWGAGRLSPGRVGLLLMLEIVVGVASAAWLTDEPFGRREILGTLLILGAGAVEVLGRRG